VVLPRTWARPRVCQGLIEVFRFRDRGAAARLRLRRVRAGPRRDSDFTANRFRFRVRGAAARLRLRRVRRAAARFRLQGEPIPTSRSGCRGATPTSSGWGDRGATPTSRRADSDFAIGVPRRDSDFVGFEGPRCVSAFTANRFRFRDRGAAARLRLRRVRRAAARRLHGESIPISRSGCRGATPTSSGSGGRGATPTSWRTDSDFAIGVPRRDSDFVGFG